MEAGSGTNGWGNRRLGELLAEEREVEHVELGEFLVRYCCSTFSFNKKNAIYVVVGCCVVI